MKKDILNRNVRLLKSMLISMHSILGWAFFFINDCISAAWHGGNQPVACSGVMEAHISLIAAFRSSALLSLVSPIFLLTMPHRFSMGFRSGEFAGQSSTPTPWPLNQLLVPLAVWAGAKFCWKMKSASPWSLSAEGSIKCSKFSWWLQKTQWTNNSRWHGSPNHHWLWKLHTGFQATWILCLSSLPPDSGTLISKLNATFPFIWKEDFGPLSNSPVLFLLSPGKMLLTMFLFQKWLDSPFPEDVWVWWLLMHWLQLQFTPCEALLNVSTGLAWLYSQACVIPVACAHFPTHFFPF